MSGWIRIDRKILDNPVLNEKPFDRFHAWMDILLRVEYEPRTVKIKNTEIELQPGQILVTMRDLADRWGWSHQKVIRFIDELEQNDMWTTLRTTSWTTLTLVNWGKYQSARTTSRTTSRTTLLENSIILTDLKEQSITTRARKSKFRNYDERHTDYETLFGEVGK